MLGSGGCRGENGGGEGVGDIGSGVVAAETEGVSARRIRWRWAVERGSGDCSTQSLLVGRYGLPHS